MKTFPKITTQRLKLRQTIKKDWKEILYLRTSKEVNKYIKSTLKQPTNETDTKAFIEKIYTKGFKNGDNINWSIIQKSTNEMIGSICYWNFSEDRKKAEIGYSLIPKFHNKKYMTESLKSILDFGIKDLKLNTIEAFTHHKNEASKKLLQKFDFKLLENKTDKENPDNLIYHLKIK